MKLLLNISCEFFLKPNGWNTNILPFYGSLIPGVTQYHICKKKGNLRCDAIRHWREIDLGVFPMVRDNLFIAGGSPAFLGGTNSPDDDYYSQQHTYCHHWTRYKYCQGNWNKEHSKYANLSIYDFSVIKFLLHIFYWQ